MILQDWLKELDYTLIQGNPDTQVEEVIYDSRKRDRALYLWP